MVKHSASPPRVLCLDGGGIRGLSQILILKELMLEVRLQNKLDFTPEPNNCFDFICGTEAGGLIVILLGRLGMSLAECEEIFSAFSTKIFQRASGRTLFGLLRRQRVRRKLHKILTPLVGLGSMSESGAQVKVPVAVTSLDRSTLDDHLFRTYGGWAHEDCRITDACSATILSSLTTTINGVGYVSGILARNNPSGLALEELESDSWLSPLADSVDEVSCLVSIGGGRPEFKESGGWLRRSSTLEGITAVQGALDICSRITCDTHAEHVKIRKRFTKAGRDEVYFRFDLDSEFKSDLLGVERKKSIQRIMTDTKPYLQRAGGDLARCAILLEPDDTR